MGLHAPARGACLMSAGTAADACARRLLGVRRHHRGRLRAAPAWWPPTPRWTPTCVDAASPVVA